MGVRLSGGIGPLRASIPLGPLMFALLIGPVILMWWMVLYFMIWPCKLLCYDLPRAIQRRRQNQPAGPDWGPRP